MHAAGFTRSLPIDDERSLVDFETPVPAPGPRDLLIKVEAASVNPVDTLRRRRAAADRTLKQPMILGFDGAGVVTEIGTAARLFQPGDAVWYAGNVFRSGSNAEYQLVDERIVGRRPRNETRRTIGKLAIAYRGTTSQKNVAGRRRAKRG